MREFKVFQIIAVNDFIAEDIQGGEKPAAPGMLLVGDGTLLQVNAEGIGKFLQSLIVSSCIDKAVVNGSCRGNFIGAVGVESF